MYPSYHSYVPFLPLACILLATATTVGGCYGPSHETWNDACGARWYSHPHPHPLSHPCCPPMSITHIYPPPTYPINPPIHIHPLTNLPLVYVWLACVTASLRSYGLGSLPNPPIHIHSLTYPHLPPLTPTSLRSYGLGSLPNPPIHIHPLTYPHLPPPRLDRMDWAPYLTLLYTSTP